MINFIFSSCCTSYRAILHDEAHFPDPEAYKPERFLAEDRSLDPSVRDPTVAAFGFGRRICPGRFLALDSMWLTIARVLAVFEINKALDADGNEITPDGEYHRGFLWQVVSCACLQQLLTSFIAIRSRSL